MTVDDERHLRAWLRDRGDDGLVSPAVVRDVFGELDRTRTLALSLAARVADQSELLSRRAGRRVSAPAPGVHR